MSKKRQIKLCSDQCKKLLHIVRAGKHKSREILYAHILLKAVKGWTDATIQEKVDYGQEAGGSRLVRMTLLRQAAGVAKFLGSASEDEQLLAR